MSATAPDPSEQVLWEGTPSQWQNLGWWLACLLLLPIPIALWKGLATRCTRYTLTDQRLKLREGVLNRQTRDTELYRIKDTRLEQSLLQRLVGIGNVVLSSSDVDMPVLAVNHIADAETVREQIRRSVERARERKGVREMDLGRDQH